MLTATLFASEIPVPRPALEAAAGELDLAEPGRALEGVISAGRGTRGLSHAAVNPLARPLAEADAPLVAGAVLQPLAAAWRYAEGDFPCDPCGRGDPARASSGAPEPALLEPAAEAAVIHLFHFAHAAPAAGRAVRWTRM